MDYKSIKFEVKSSDSDEDRIIEGWASTYDVDSGDDQIERGAFEKTISERFFEPKSKNGKSKIKVLWQHDTSDLIGTILELKETEEGLYCKIKLFDDPVFVSADRAYKLAKLGEIDSFSIGYRATKWEHKELSDSLRIRVITELKLFEISVVTFPMNEKAEFTSVKEQEFDIKMNDQIVQLLSEIKSLLEKTLEKKEVQEFEEKTPFELEEVKEASETLLEEKAADCKGCGKPMKMMCPDCEGEEESTEDCSKNDAPAFDLAAFKEEILSEVKAMLNPVKEIVEEKSAEVPELKLEDIFEFLLNKEINL